MWKKIWIKQAIQRLDQSGLPVHLRLWDGSEHGPVEAGIRISLRTPGALHALAAPTLGSLARAYVEGSMDIDGDIRAVLSAGETLCDAANARDAKGSATLSWLRHSRPRDRLNIAYHYDISDDFYTLWLDGRRVYSCAYFRRPDDSLERAQEQKLDLICRKLMLRPGDRLLDIGCGWGGLVFWAAEHYGVHALGITLSKNQHAHVRDEIRRRSLEQRVEVRLEDYRDVPGQEAFDKIASIGMFEHVGRKHLDAYFGHMARLLRPGGLALNHGITASGVGSTGLRSGIGEFIEQYVFPGGDLVHVSRVVESLGRAGLECLDVESLRPHYAHTLWHWVDRLEANAEHAINRVGEQRYRIWRIYMAGSARAFERGWMSLHQVLVGKPAADGSHPYPYTREHLAVTGRQFA